MNERPKLTRPSEVRTWISQQQFLPSKVLGQNFLIDENILHIMLDSAALSRDDRVLEIGPGLGILTEPLMQQTSMVVAIEKDKRLAAHLAEAFSTEPIFELIQADALTVSLAEIKATRRLNKLVSNLPYSVGSRVLVECFMLAEGFETMVVTVQLEVGARLAATTDSDDYGLLSIWAQLDNEVKIAKRVSPSCFYPRPQVTSAIVVLRRTRNRRAQLKNPKLFDALIRHTFSQRRKQLGTSLGHFHFAGLKQPAADGLSRADINPSRRPETLAVEEWISLADALA